MCCTWLAENTGRKNYPKIAIWAPSHNFVGYIFTIKACIDSRKKKLVKQQYLLRMSSQYGELRPTNGCGWFGCLGHPTKFQWVLHLAFITAATSLTRGQPNFARCLAVSSTGTLYAFSGLLPPDGILPATKFTLRPSLAFSYIGSITARHSSSRRQPNFAAWYNEWNYRTFTEGATCIQLGSHHIGHRPTF